MVPRYSRKEMVEIWSDVSKYSIWLDIEIHALEGMEKVGIVPVGTAKIVKEKAKFDSKRIDEIEAEIKHDVLAFLTNISESVGPEARFIHQGMTSSDVLDTCLEARVAIGVVLAVLQGLAIAIRGGVNPERFRCDRRRARLRCRETRSSRKSHHQLRTILNCNQNSLP